MLFDEIIFGPIHSRRLGNSLGINLLPTKKKLCNFDCVYCECGWNEDTKDISALLPQKKDIEKELRDKLIQFKDNNTIIDSITFSGNGEPTLHPEFSQIIDMVVELRNHYAPEAQISVLSNATNLLKEDIFKALQKIDNPILKLDAATPKMFYAISKANPKVISFEKVKEKLILFGKDAIVQTLLLRGENDGQKLDNTTHEEFEAWLKVVKEVNPKMVMLYAIDRVTPESNLEKLSKDELEVFAQKVRAIGIETNTY
ncbi:MAG: radical SAM protein [Bacteroidales bacterium]|jgi:wyosine [tRNA(Phe)-imidazoG37] synthetase (radical SAM superfamily)|nr:radical SAM protein [Bacteroidales bacterium]MDD4703572.1 radical SAM protein [Bacteroidales bacterium]MDX9798794.1 radical SAM protein [Bacteroidales bacterium]